MNEQDRRMLSKIYVVFALAATILACAALSIAIQTHQKGTVTSEGQHRILQLLSIILIFSGSVEYVMATFLFKKIIHDHKSPASSSLSEKIRSAFIVRLSLFQSVSLFGLVIFLLAGIYGALSSHPVYLLTTVPYFILLTHIQKTFPTKDNVEFLLKESQ